MKILQVRNVHDALPQALRLLEQEGVERPSRNGPVLLGPSVTTVYEKPCERVLFWPERDANPFYHLYESLWMLDGRNDIKPLIRYAKNAANYSDDGLIWHGAYGYRWRRAFAHYSRETGVVTDQLGVIAKRLQEDPTDRRCVLQMWDTSNDLGRQGKDLPCNTMATFQRGLQGELNLTVFCRSNDIIWGAYGANAVHFSFLLEYMALWIGCPVGTYTQVSVNWHAYLDTLKSVKDIRPDLSTLIENSNPYTVKRVSSARMFHGDIKEADARIHRLLFDADTEFMHGNQFNDDEPFFDAAYIVLRAHQAWRTLEGENRYLLAQEILNYGDRKNDWIVAAHEWIQRRYAIWQAKQTNASSV